MNAAAFSKLYQNTWYFLKVPEHKQLDATLALVNWSTLLPGKYVHLPLWLEFVQLQIEQQAAKKLKMHVSRDTWDLFLVFINAAEIDERFNGYVEDAEWPSLIDEFVLYARDKLGYSYTP